MFFQVILPVFIIFALGFAGQRVFQLHIKSVSTVGLYLMTPALVFHTFYQTNIDHTYLYITIYGISLSLILIMLIKWISHLRKYDTSTESALILSSAFMNNGNYGAPVILFAFGEKGFTYALAILVLHTIVMSTVGLYYAARGKSSMREAWMSVAKMPIIHALIAAFIWRWLEIPMPEHLLKAVKYVGDAAIPTIMIVLGMQLAEIKLQNIVWGKISLALFLRLIISPVIAALIVYVLLPVDQLLGNVMIVEAAMPSAAIMTLYALQFDNEPQMVSSVTFLSTVFSGLTLTILLTIIS